MLTCWGRMTFGVWGAVGLGVASLFGGSTLHFADPLLHLFARFERDHKLLRHKDFVTRTRVAGLACGPSFDLENTEIPELDAMVLDQRLHDGVERLLDNFLGLELRKSNLLGDGFNNLFLGHDEVPYETGQMDEAAAKAAMSLMPQV